MEQMTIGVIGGSGLYEIEGLTDIEEVRIETPFGAPSDVFITGMLGMSRWSSCRVMGVVIATFRPRCLTGPISTV